MTKPRPPLPREKKDVVQTDLVFEQHLSIDFSFQIYFTRSLFSCNNPLLSTAVSRLEPSRRHRLFIVVDQGVASAQADIVTRIEEYIHCYNTSLELAGEITIVPGGEQAKNDPALIEMLHKEMLRTKIDRQSFIVGIGCGAVIDLAGYAAATFHRGIRHIRVPTTVLSQNDSGVGVKNGVNAFGVKNLLGTFAPPFAVLNDIELTQTLAPRDKLAGMAEAVKVGLIRDRTFIEWIEQNAIPLRQFEPDALGFLIQRCAELHMQHIATSGDPFEQGSARPLDFGHWAAHKLESLSNYSLRHGEAVAIGLALDTRYSTEVGLLDKGSCERIVSLLETLGFRLWAPCIDVLDTGQRPLLLDGLQEFQQHLGGDLCITLLSGIGTMVEARTIDQQKMLSSCQWLKKRDTNCN
jgi:3-dehydroquinate synthase